MRPGHLVELNDDLFTKYLIMALQDLLAEEMIKSIRKFNCHNIKAICVIAPCHPARRSEYQKS